MLVEFGKAGLLDKGGEETEHGVGGVGGDEVLGVPLHGKDGQVGIAVEHFNDSVRAPSGSREARCDFLDGLMMATVDSERCHSNHFGRLGAGFDIDIVGSGGARL